MSLEILDISVVVLARFHNPTVLHLDFLKREGIVPKDWQEDLGACITSLPFAAVKFTNGFSVTVEPNKLQVIDPSPPVDCRDSAAPTIAGKYVKTLPHVLYTAVGINLTGFVPKEKAKEYLVNRFLREGPWGEKPLNLSGFSAVLAFQLTDATVRFTFDSAKIDRGGTGEREGLVVKANYHSDIAGENTASALTETTRLIETSRDRCDHFLSVGPSLLGLGA